MAIAEGYQYGVLLPHFGTQASRERLIAGSRLIEELGFDSVWVRDHLVYHPHGYEDASRTHLDPLVTLSLVAGATERITLGTASIIPHRHPIHAALAMASLEFVAGPGRVIIGMGLGSFDHEFQACGLGHADRRELMAEQVTIFRKLWTGQPVTHRGKYYQFADVDIHPTPSTPIPIWYCGDSQAAVRRAVEYCDGWLPGVMPIGVFKRQMERLLRLVDEAGKPALPIGQIPLVVPAPTVEEALRYYHLPHIFRFCNAVYGRFGGGPYQAVEDLDGAIVYGPPDRIVEEVLRYQQAGCNLFVFDLRLRFADFEECVELIAREVLPKLPHSSSLTAP